MSFSFVHGTLSSLKTCRGDFSVGMEIATDVAMDLAEAQGKDATPAIKEMEAMILECAKLEREIDCFADITQNVISQAATQQPEAMFNLSAKVKEQFAERIASLSDADLQKHRKVVAFKEGIKNALNQDNPESSPNTEQLDDDIAVTQSQIKLTCPVTQVDMVNPMKNKKCNHHYDEQAIMGLIKMRRNQKKKCCCPVVGCGNTDVKESDLVPDQLLKRRIQNQKNRASHTQFCVSLTE
ncbi:E3 SUMO-protein ligase NSE2 [Brachionichthys hirsutus]|uniref:E3 SUMO-protein ligase NSE2 n=1 Tax=Brachionichthys hirsutus TaxID=412623 RepID=UPI0036050019